MRILLLCIFLISCNPQNRLNRKVKRAENYAYKHGLVIKDTIKVVDTVIIESYISRHYSDYNKDTIAL